MKNLPLLLLTFLAFKVMGAHPHSTKTSAPTLGITSLDVMADENRIHLLTARVVEALEMPVLEYHYSEDGGRMWSVPVVVNEDLPPYQGARRGMDAQIAAMGHNIFATWMTKGTGLFESGPMVTAISSDGGNTWAAAGNPSSLNTTDGRGFADAITSSDNRVNLVWLENRDGQRGLAFARSEDHGKSWKDHAHLDAETCECCWNTISEGPNGEIAILYRDKSPRDMNLLVSLDKGKSWTKPENVGNFNWELNACPHVGGGISFHKNEDDEDVLGVVQWTGKEGRVGVYYSKKCLASQQWKELKKLGDPTANHPDISSDGKSQVLVVWDQMTNGSTSILAAHSDDGGNTFSHPILVSSPHSSATHPRVIHHKGQFHIFWTEYADKDRRVWKHRTGYQPIK